MNNPQVSSFKFRVLISAAVAALAFLLASGMMASAQNITGTVTNGTTGKPAGGDEVTLLSLSQGMQEVGSTKTDAQGKFTLKAPPEANVPHMVRVTHGGVSYFPRGGPLMPGNTSAEVTVYDAAKKIDGLSQTVEVDRYQSDGSQLQVIALFAVNNESKPPRTQVDNHTFTFVVPEGATIDSGLARGPGGQPINDQPTEAGAKNQYAFSFPLKPGETQFQVSYHLPYSGKASFAPKPLADVQHYVVMTPPGITFTPKNPQRYQSMPNQPGVMVATDAKPGDDLSFAIAGSGQFPAEREQAAGGGEAAGGGGAMGGGGGGRDNRPGGGLGAPIDSNDPLYEYRAVILGVFALVLVMGGFYVIGKSNATRPVAAAAGAAVSVAVADSPAPGDRSTKLLDAMKDELFHLELDRQQGKLSAEEYAKAKAALDETIRRALARADFDTRRPPLPEPGPLLVPKPEPKISKLNRYQASIFRTLGAGKDTGAPSSGRSAILRPAAIAVAAVIAVAAIWVGFLVANEMQDWNRAKLSGDPRAFLIYHKSHPHSLRIAVAQGTVASEVQLEVAPGSSLVSTASPKLIITVNGKPMEMSVSDACKAGIIGCEKEGYIETRPGRNAVIVKERFSGRVVAVDFRDQPTTNQR